MPICSAGFHLRERRVADDDLYGVLGVKRDASADDIRKAWRKLAKTLHPDLNPGDKGAEDRFKRAQGAFDILGDPDKRGRYDRGEIDASGAERPERQFYRRYADAGAGQEYRSHAGFADFGDMGDVFADLFRHAGAQGGGPRGAHGPFPGRDLHYQLEVEFLDAANGAKRRITMPDGRSLDLSIPAGMRDGQTLRLAGQGMPGFDGGKAGDALVEVHVRPHPLFRRDGDDIHVELPVTLGEAVLGGKVRVPTIGGDVTLTVPSGAGSGTRLRLGGRGVARPGGGRGDQVVTLKVVLPERPDEELKQFLAGWQARHPYDPRAGMTGGGDVR
ncbi:MAG: DnaJ C-terminal domain-containing protein [Alphaproteobacteria bacterium]